MSGLPSEHFLFYGFLNSKDSKMREELNNLKNFENTIIFYEAPHRLIKFLQAILDVFGDRYVSISKEISKLHESVFRGNISDAIKSLEEDEFVKNVLGEKIAGAYIRRKKKEWQEYRTMVTQWEIDSYLHKF